MKLGYKMIGNKFGNWLVLEEAGRDKKSNKLFLCKCSCGYKKIQREYTLKKGESTQCKKCRMDSHNNITNIIGLNINGLKVLKRTINIKNQSAYLVKCICGKEKVCLGYKLRRGNASKCPNCRIKTHGMSYTLTFKTWQSMLSRCSNSKLKAYKYYGARGIKVCESWLKFENFLNDMGSKPDGLSIDRINNDGNYEPSNCRWATNKEQLINRRPLSSKKNV